MGSCQRKKTVAPVLAFIHPHILDDLQAAWEKKLIFGNGRAAVFGDLVTCQKLGDPSLKTSQELRMLSSVTINCQVTKIFMKPGFQLSVL